MADKEVKLKKGNNCVSKATIKSFIDKHKECHELRARLHELLIKNTTLQEENTKQDERLKSLACDCIDLTIENKRLREALEALLNQSGFVYSGSLKEEAIRKAKQALGGK